MADRGRADRILVLPALFDEANKLRRQTVEVMRRLDEAGIDTFLPDLPGMNESMVALSTLSFADWIYAAQAAAAHFKATHVLTWRGGALLAPGDLPGWHYAPVDGAKQLRAMLRARTISAREVGREEKLANLQELARAEGIELGGWQLSQTLFAGLEEAELAYFPDQTAISHSEVGGTSLWLRAEPDEDVAQATALAAIIVQSLSHGGHET